MFNWYPKVLSTSVLKKTDIESAFTTSIFDKIGVECAYDIDFGKKTYLEWKIKFKRGCWI